jgi:hypothetical protein
MEIYQSEDFIEKFSEKVKDILFKDALFDSELTKMKTKINKILQKENLYFDNEGYLVLQPENKESEIRICNFFILPTHSLHFDDGEKIHAAGIAVELYSPLNGKEYKRILVNLSDEVIEKGSWLNTTFIDRDFFVYKSDLYRYLRIAIKLSSRVIKDKAKKVFYNDEWLEDDEAVQHISEYKNYLTSQSIQKISNVYENEVNQKIDAEAMEFLIAQSQYISMINMLSFPEENSEVTNEWGWEDNEYFYLVYSNTWRWIRAYFNRKGIKLISDEKDLDHYLIEAGVFESNEVRPKNKLKRADRNTRPLKQRVFMINKVRFNELLSQRENER